MSFGMITLVVVTVLILFGVAQRVLDRLRLSDRMALLFVALIFIGSLVPEIPIGNLVRINIGGALVPVALCVYLFIRANETRERVRSVAAALVTGGAVYLLGRIMPSDPVTMPFDPNYIYGLAGGIIAYLMGRSRRAAFIAGVMGVLLADLTVAMVNWYSGIMQPVRLGGGGGLDAVVISGLLAVLLAELIGEILERMSRGDERPDREYKDGEFVRAEHNEKEHDRR